MQQFFNFKVSVYFFYSGLGDIRLPMDYLLSAALIVPLYESLKIHLQSMSSSAFLSDSHQYQKRLNYPFNKSIAQG